MIDPQLRIEINVWLEQTAMKLNLSGKRVLEIGIAGDEKPSGSYRFFGKGNEWQTLDKNSKWSPDIVADICNSGLPSNSFDLVIITQSLEHIWDYKAALSELYRITKKYVIVDCPFMVPMHQDTMRVINNKPLEWDDYWRFTPAAFDRLLKEAGFEKIDIQFKNLNSIALCEK